MTRWSLRTRLTVLAVGTVAVAVVGVALGSYLIVRGRLYQQFDDQVRSYAQLAASTSSPDDALATLQTADRRHPDIIVQFLTPNVVAASGESRPIPVTPIALNVVNGQTSAAAETLTIDHDRYRVWTVSRPGGAAQVARDAEGTERTLSELGLLVGLVGVVGVALAALAGRRLAVAGLRPVDTLTSAAERVAETQDLSNRIAVDGRGEIARLAEAFNAMLTALAESRDSQRRLVQDAGHELRTPLTSLRNNVELLVHAGVTGLPAQDLDRLLSDLGAQTVELSTLVEELVLLAREDGKPSPRSTVNLADIVAAAVERAGPRAPHIRFEVSMEPASLVGEPSSLERAVLNLLDNAVKWSPPGGAVRVGIAVDHGTAQVSVADEGPGIPENDLPHVFKRFYRADSARAMPGSGLGLAIVERIAAQHGGSVRAGRAETGGALVTVALPVNGSQANT
jgi:two-component system sensor histidine kinase MprB